MLHMSRRKAKVLIQGSVHLKWQLPELFNAALSQIAELLKTVQGDESSLDVRKAKAFGVLSRPAYALALIQQGAKHLPEQEPLLEPVDEFGQPLHGPSERYLPAGCAPGVPARLHCPI